MSKRGPGRPPAFDRTAVLDTVMRMFWRHGYTAVSMPDVCAATGLSTSSLYNSFGTKLDLFVAALARYHDTVLEAFMLGPMARGEQGLDDVEAFLDRLGSTLDATVARGCLAVNTIAEFRDPPPSVAEHTARYRQLLRMSLRAALGRAAELGQIPPDSVDARTEALVPMVLAYNLLTAAQAPTQERRELLSTARGLARH
ncbi:TetR/AcrR family transcriptional regulator [Pseudonocardia spinosispora]|uniref:TetR/AcrR family transcriptional regulator n=1 Tax=Pseudonocardia spinosispora TaxID=103441 RepID=UPI00146F9949|nr:TetR/AcrR family transcriptional regulator [Pseudonocardia spinosispora]